MPKPNAAERLERLLRLLDLLRDGGPSTATELGKQLGMSSRTVLRDFEKLLEGGVSIVRGDDGTYRLDKNTVHPWGLTESEAIRLLIVLRNLGQTQVGFLGNESLDAVAKKLESTMSAWLRKRAEQYRELFEFQPFAQASPDRSSAFFDLLVASAIRRQRVRIRYRSLSEEMFLETDLAPYRILYAKRSWYCVGHSSLHREVRTFHLGRIATLEEMTKRFRVPKSFSLEDYFGQAWRLIREDKTYDVAVRFSSRVAKNVAEIDWHPSQEVEWEADGSIVFRARVAGVKEISWWILGYGREAEVIAPPELRELIREHALAMLTQSGTADDENGVAG